MVPDRVNEGEAGLAETQAGRPVVSDGGAGNPCLLMTAPQAAPR
jgi:hypothetical protein